jgi:hypothetical protein
MSTRVRPAKSAPAPERPPRLLQRRTADAVGIEFDAYQRYALAAQLVERLCLSCDGVVRVLEVGAGPELAGRFFDPGAVQVTRVAEAAPALPAGDRGFESNTASRLRTLTSTKSSARRDISFIPIPRSGQRNPCGCDRSKYHC